MRDAGHRTPDAGHRTSDIGHRTSDNGHRTSDIGHRTAKKAKIIYPPPRGVDIITPITKIPKFTTCELSDIIYLITCKKCNKYYVGETSRPFRKRMYEHRLSVSQPRENRITPVSKHFTEKGHSVKDMQFSVLEWCSLKYHKPDSNHRKMREKWWMWNIGAIHPIGINQFI